MTYVNVKTGDSVPSDQPRHPIVLVLDRLRSAYNVGNVFRLAEICHVEAVYTCGYTATPPHPKLKKTARGCDDLVPCRHFDTAVDAVTDLKERGYTVMGVETVDGAPTLWDVDYVFPLAFVLGNEALGISEDALAMCDGYVQLPTFGSKNSLNVGNAASAVLYQAMQFVVTRSPTSE